MEKKYPLWQRITSATPAFFKRVQVFALAVAGLGGTLATVHGIPQALSASLISAGTAIAAVAQFAVKLDGQDCPSPPPVNTSESKSVQ